MSTFATARRFITGTVVALVVALIATQAIGFRHGIRHADRTAGLVASIQAQAGAETADAGIVEHSCAAFDAAALAFAAVPQAAVDLPPFGAFARFSRPVTRAPPSTTALAYRSRAPPYSSLA